MSSSQSEQGSASRKVNTSAPATGYTVAGPAYGPPVSQAQAMRNAQYMHHHDGTGNGPALLNHEAMALVSPHYGANHRSGPPTVIHTGPPNVVQYSESAGIGHQGPNMIQIPNGPAVYYPGPGPMIPGPYHFMGQNSPYGYAGDNGNPAWNGRVPSGSSTNLPPLLAPRRSGSMSSNEDHVPGTPGYHQYYSGVAIMDRSPSGVFTHNTTPSPSSYIQNFNQVHPGQTNNLAVYSSGTKSNLTNKLQALISQEPAIPPAIPAPNSPIKSLDRSLENKNGETNVYIRGLSPDTTDEMLFEFGKRFGDVASSKAIIDHKTNLCKGFGFVKYHNFENAEDCIRGFHSLGYEVSFARESFYSKLKKFSDELNTNLYVSNIPRNLNEHELAGLFEPYKVLSARILRDENGNGRGVGFARFENRDTCEEIVKQFNNTTIHRKDVDYLIQIRFSDTPEQKVLKQQTAAARMFRAAEYDAGCAQVGRIVSPSSNRPLYTPTYSQGGDYEPYMQQTPIPHAYRRPQLPSIVSADHSVSSQVMATPPTVRVQDVDQKDASPSAPAKAGAEEN